MSTLFLLNAAVQNIPEAALSAEGGALMAALVGKVKAAAQMLYDLTLKEESVSEKVLQALADLHVALEHSESPLKSKSKPSRRTLSKCLSDGRYPWPQRVLNRLDWRGS